MTIIDNLMDREQWELFLQYKREGGHMPVRLYEDLAAFIDGKEYLPVVERIRKGEPFSYPEAVQLNKKAVGKKRVVYTLPREENYVLKMIAWQLQKYDGIFSPNLYSFRKETGVKKAVSDLVLQNKHEKMFSYKVDIRDYFNSVDIKLLLPILKNVLKDEKELYHFFKRLLENPFAWKDGELVEEKKGIMAGLPVSAFLANLYLAGMDWEFYEAGIPYARYSDDIIVFAATKEALKELKEKIHDTLKRYHLIVNPKKEKETAPEDAWEYLGFSCEGNQIDVADAAIEKLKGKLKRKARAIYRWKIKNNKPDEAAIRAYIKYFNRKFFENPVHNEITWCRWYFPIITREHGIRIIDHYMQDCIRFLVTGQYKKSNYNVRYETMKKLGYRSLVNEFYQYKKGKKEQ